MAASTNNTNSSVIEREEQGQGQRFGPGIRRTPIIYRVTTGNLSEYTKRTYQYYINDFLAFYKITDIKGIEPLKEYIPKLIRQMVLDFVIHLRDFRKISRSSIKIHCAALSLFFYMIRDDDTRLDWTKVRMEFPPDERIHRDRAYTVDEIQKILDNGCAGRLREKAIILLLTSTGMRIGGIHPLKYGDFSPKDTDQGKVYRVEVYSGSSAHYYCYCNVESAKSIDDYLKERTDKGEILQNDSPLFRDLRLLNVKNVKGLSDTEEGVPPKKLTPLKLCTSFREKSILRIILLRKLYRIKSLFEGYTTRKTKHLRG
jgi:site-specific recombinase XerD